MTDKPSADRDCERIARYIIDTACDDRPRVCVIRDDNFNIRGRVLCQRRRAHRKRATVYDPLVVCPRRDARRICDAAALDPIIGDRRGESRCKIVAWLNGCICKLSLGRRCVIYRVLTIGTRWTRWAGHVAISAIGTRWTRGAGHMVLSQTFAIFRLLADFATWFSNKRATGRIGFRLISR
jgi:hypothetical protein